MWKFRTDVLVKFFLILGLWSSFFFHSFCAFAQDIVDPQMKRKVSLTLKSEPNAKKYIVEVYPAKGEKLDYQIDSPQWQEYLLRGQYRIRFKIMFADETESNWSEFRNFTVEDYKISMENLDDGMGSIAADVNNQTKTVLQWTSLVDALTYTVSIYQAEQYQISLQSHHQITKKKIFNDKPLQVIDGLQKNSTEVLGLESGVYKIKIVARDVKNKIIAVTTNNVELYDLSKLSPRLIAPPNDFVRDISWDKVSDFNRYAITVYQKNVDPLEMLKYNIKSYPTLSFRIPSVWEGGEYTFCVKTFIRSKTYSTDSCIDFNIKQGDRTRVAENKYYGDIVKHRNRQYYHRFNLISSKIEYKSLNPSLASVVEINGQVLNFSYSKSDPGFSENLNQYFKLDAGYFKLPSKSDLVYDFRYGQEYSHYNSYPAIIKVNGGLGLDKIIQSTTDARSATQLNVFSHHMLNAFINASVQYNYLAKNAFDFRVGYQKTLAQLTKAENQTLKNGASFDYSINALFNRENSNDRFEIGYLYKKSAHTFKATVADEPDTELTQNGHYINIGYIMEAK